MATVATRQRENLVQRKSRRIDLTPTGLLMEGHCAQVRGLAKLSAIEIFHQPTNQPEADGRPVHHYGRIISFRIADYSGRNPNALSGAPKSGRVLVRPAFLDLTFIKSA